MKFNGVNLNVDGKTINSLDLNYNQLVWLYNDFKKRNGRVPTTKDCSSKNNLPQSRIVNKILKDKNETYKDFMNKFGEVGHVRADSDDYLYYVNRFKTVSNKIGRALIGTELTNNEYGLPSATWFVNYCPNESVKSYDDFVRWCGFESNKLEKDKDYVSSQLIELEKKLKRPIVKSDITIDNVGFSNIVICRIWGGLSNCKKELGLMETPTSHPKPFIEYKTIIDNIISSFKTQTTRKYITWADIENNSLGIAADHKTLSNAFMREGLNIKTYIESMGLTMNNSSFSFQYLFDDGEKVISTLEYDLSLYLKNELHFLYNINYQRDVMYKSFTSHDKKSRINCDYVIAINDSKYYIEVAGLIDYANGNWETTDFGRKMKNQYRDKLAMKKNILEQNKLDYLFLFPEDFKTNNYKSIVSEFLRLKGGD